MHLYSIRTITHFANGIPVYLLIGSPIAKMRKRATKFWERNSFAY